MPHRDPVEALIFWDTGFIQHADCVPRPKVRGACWRGLAGFMSKQPAAAGWRYVARWTRWLWAGLGGMISRKGGARRYFVIVLKRLRLTGIHLPGT